MKEPQASPVSVSLFKKVVLLVMVTWGMIWLDAAREHRVDAICFFTGS